MTINGLDSYLSSQEETEGKEEKGSEEVQRKVLGTCAWV